jgi:hypothetical protein
MGIAYEVTATTGTYTDSQGQEKRRYTKMGVVLETKNGLALKLESIPVGWDGFAYLNEPRGQGEGQRRQGTQQHAPAPAPSGDGFEDEDLPF